MTKIAESGSGSISQRHGPADPDPHQNVMNPEHWFKFPPTTHCLGIVPTQLQGHAWVRTLRNILAGMV
jgi:hypothetical protein